MTSLEKRPNALKATTITQWGKRRASQNMRTRMRMMCGKRSHNNKQATAWYMIHG